MIPIPLDFLGYYQLEILLAFILLLFIILVISFLNQRSRYKRLRKWIKQGNERVKSRDDSMQKLEKKVNTLKKSQEGLNYWSSIRGELGELSKLPSLEEKEDEIILKTQLSKLKKDDTDVTATPEEIKINIYSERIPLKCSYHLPAKINPNKLVITYKGNTLEIHAPKA